MKAICWSLILVGLAFPPVSNGEQPGRPAADSSNFAEALSLLEKQPRTERNVTRAEQLLHLVDNGNGPRRAAAKYLLARIAEVHDQAPNLKLALERYDDLIASIPNHPLAQAAVAKRIRLAVYHGSGDPRQALEDAETWTGRLTDADALRDYHLLMGRSLLFFAMDAARARAHFEAALALGLNDPINRANVLVTVAELYRRSGEANLAIPFYETFLADYPRDQRQRMVRDRMLEINSLPR